MIKKIADFLVRWIIIVMTLNSIIIFTPHNPFIYATIGIVFLLAILTKGLADIFEGK